MSSEKSSKAPAWFRDQKKRIIIFLLILACLLSTLQTVGLAKKVAATTTVITCLEKYVNDSFSILPFVFGSDLYDTFDDFDGYEGDWDINTLPDFFIA